MKKIYSINVPGAYGYSFAVKGEIDCEEDAIEMASNNGLFTEPEDADYAVAEDITDSEYDINAFKDCTYEVETTLR